jgi:hypothetical protein
MKKDIIMTAISFLIIAISLISIATIYAQNTTTDSINVETVKPHLDEAKKAFASGDYAEALKHIDLAEEQLDIADDIIEVKIGKD